MMQSSRYVHRTYTPAAILVLIVALLFAFGIIDVTFGGLLIAGAILLLALALLSRVAEWPNLAGPLLGWAYTIAVVIFLVLLLTPL